MGQNLKADFLCWQKSEDGLSSVSVRAPGSLSWAVQPLQEFSVLHNSVGESRDAFCCPLQVLRPLSVAGNGERADFPEPALKDPVVCPSGQAWLCALAGQIPGISLGSNAKQNKTV